MTLYLIGLGLRDPEDITVKGLNAIKKCDTIYLESYTSRLNCSVEDLEEFYGKKIIIADREIVESKAEDTMMKDAKNGNSALLVIGDPLGATTHTDIIMRCEEEGIPVEIIHNASVLNVVGITGLELYKFGKATSIPFDNENVKTPVDVFEKNKEYGLHTLFLLDLHPLDEKFMQIKEAANYLIQKGISEDTLAIGMAGLGDKNAEIKYLSLKELACTEFERIPQCMIIPGNLHFVEEESIERFKK